MVLYSVCLSHCRGKGLRSPQSSIFTPYLIPCHFWRFFCPLSVFWVCGVYSAPLHPANPLKSFYFAFEIVRCSITAPSFTMPNTSIIGVRVENEIILPHKHIETTYIFTSFEFIIFIGFNCYYSVCLSL